MSELTNSISTTKATVLLVGQGEALAEALIDALKRYSIVIERASRDELIQAVTTTAPDLVVLCGDMVRDGGKAALEVLASDSVASMAPIALLLDDASLDERLRAFRSGAVAVIARGASADAIAKRVSDLCKELPDRPGEAAGALGEATLEELADLVARKLRSGILSVEHVDKNSPPVRLMLGSGGGVAAALDKFIEDIRPLIADATPLRYELFETVGGRLKLWDEAEEDTNDAIYEDLRIVVMDDDPGRADEFALALRERGALVAITAVSKSGIHRARQLDPAVIVLDASAIEGEGFEIVRRIRRDPRLRWASLLVAKWGELWPPGMAAPDLERVSSRLMPLITQDRELTERSLGDEPFDTRLELTGPSRMIRAISRSEGTRVVATRSSRVAVDVDLMDGLVVSAQGRVDGKVITGTEALTSLLTLGSGRVRVERRTHPAAANVMLPVDEALDAALLPSEAPSAAPPPLVHSEPPVDATSPTVPSLTSLGLRAPAVPKNNHDDTAATKAPPAGYVSERDDNDPLTPERTATKPVRAQPKDSGKIGMLKTQMGLGGFTIPKPGTIPRTGSRAPTPSSGVPRPPPEDLRQEQDQSQTRRAPPIEEIEVALADDEPTAGSTAASPPSPDSSDSSENVEDLLTLPPDAILESESGPLSASNFAAVTPSFGDDEIGRARALLGPPSVPVADDDESDIQISMDAPSGQIEAHTENEDVEENEEVAADEEEDPPSMTDLDTLPPGGLPKRSWGVPLGVLVALLVIGGYFGAKALRPSWFGAPGQTVSVDPVTESPVTETETEATGAQEVEAAQAEAEAAAQAEAEAATQAEAEAAAQAQAASAAVRTGDLSDEALQQLSDRERGRRSDVDAREAERAIGRGELDTATARVRRALLLEPRNPQAIAARAALHIAQSDGAAAVEWAQRATQRRPRRSAYQVLLGDAQRVAGDQAAATAAYRRALELDPDNRQARSRLQ